jgi:hypothetical protein
MSASEKLKALNDRHYAADSAGERQAERTSLWVALPQIVAVVEAAETLSECPYRDAVDPPYHNGCSFCAEPRIEVAHAALDALGEALS